MLKGFLIGIVFTVLAAAVAGYAIISTGVIPANADAKPGPIEEFVAGASLRATLDREAPKGPNPVSLTDAHLLDGVRLYAANCAVCHGSARGDDAASPIAKGEYPAPPQLATDGVEDDPEGVTFWKLEHGIRWSGMPSWKGHLSDTQMWTLALFLKHMDKLPPQVESAWKAVPDPVGAPSGSDVPAAAAAAPGPAPTPSLAPSPAK